MTAAEGPKQGQSEAHTRPAPAPGDAIEAADAMAGTDPEALLLGSPDIDATDLLGAAAELMAAPRRGRGRPSGSGNRKNADMVKHLAALGHRDPWVTLSMIQTADTMALAMALRVPMQEDGVVKTDHKGNVLYNPPQPGFVLSIQRQAAKDLMDYHHAKKPQQLELPGGDGAPRNVMIIGQMNVGQIGGRYASDELGVVEKPNEINGDAVRTQGGQSHDDEDANDNNGLG